MEQLHFDSPSGQLLMLNSGLADGESQRSNIAAWDLETQVEVSRTMEFMEAYALCCFAPLSEPGSSPLYIAGAVHAGAPALFSWAMLDLVRQEHWWHYICCSCIWVVTH